MTDPPEAGAQDANQQVESPRRLSGASCLPGADTWKSPDSIEEVDSPRTSASGPVFSPEEHRAKATKLLALLLFGALVISFIAHFVSILCLAHDKPDSVEEVTRVFSTWTPVFAGLFGSAATFYFTQGRK
jgi:hypothetical protein